MTMRKILGTAVVVSMVVSSLVALAATTPTATKVKEKAAKVIAVRNDRITAFAENAKRRLSKTLELQLTLMGRVENHLSKLEAAGKDVKAAQAKLAEAKVAAGAAKETVLALTDETAKLISSYKPKDAFTKVRALVKTTQDAVKEAHKKLTDAVKELKNRPQPTATSTPQTNSNQ